GFFWVAAQHEALPAAGNSSPIFGGKWSLSTFWGKFGGTVLGGSIFNNGNNTFNVSVTLELKSGGTGQHLGAVVLDHNDFPPTVEGKLYQPYTISDHPVAPHTRCSESGNHISAPNLQKFDPDRVSNVKTLAEVLQDEVQAG